jgi:glycosyltransferase involved in cell wall biosynthesis
MTSGASEINRRITAKEDIDESEVAALLESPNPQERQLGYVALVRTHLRKACYAAAGLANAQNYSDQSTLDVINKLGPLLDTDIPMIEVFKGLGIRDARNGDFDSAMKYLQEAVNRGFGTGQLRDPRSESAMGFIHDPEIDRALEGLAAGFAPPRSVALSKDRISILISAMIDESGPSIVQLKYVQAMRERGFDVDVVSTEYASSLSARFYRQLLDENFDVFLARGENARERVQSLLRRFEERPVSAIVYMPTIMDNVAKVVSCIGLAPVQVFSNIAYEPYVGNFQWVLQMVSKEQESQTHWPGKSRFVGSVVALAKEIDAAQPIDRATIGVPDDGVMIGTYGRLSKCTSPEYLTALARILSAEPTAHLVLAGPASEGDLHTIISSFQQNALAERVHYLGRRQKDGPQLLKATDVYCDTYPWPGGQSLYDAMQAGLPVVAMRRKIDLALDPSGVGPPSALAEVTIGEGFALANAGDVDGYVAIALAYIRDAELRRTVGKRMRGRVVEIAGFDRHMDTVAQLLRESVAAVGV